MSILSPNYPLLIILFVTAFFIVPKRMQWYIVLAVSSGYYLLSGVLPFLVVFFTSLFAYTVGLSVQKFNDEERTKTAACTDSEEKKEIRRVYEYRKKRTVYISAALIIGLWFVFRKLLNNSSLFGKAVILPLGISFYSLNIISYLFDCQRGKTGAEKNFFKFFCFVIFFPHIVQGPFSRYDVMRKELFAEHSFSYDRMLEGVRRILYGYFKKIVIADRLAPIVGKIVENHIGYQGYVLFAGLILYSIELYCDFSGYMDIMCGICKIIDVKLKENFKQPYFSLSLEEFWRRWHISLGEWFKEYVFYPVSVNKSIQKAAKKIRNKLGNKAGKMFAALAALFSVWTLTGLWHSFTLNYLIWGYLNMAVIGFSMYFADQFNECRNKLKINPEDKWYRFLSMFRLFLIICLIRVFSITPDIRSALGYYAGFFTSKGENLFSAFADESLIGLCTLAVSVLAVLIVDILNETKRWESVKEKCPIPVRVLIFALITVSFLLYAGASGNIMEGFIYARF